MKRLTSLSDISGLKLEDRKKRKSVHKPAPKAVPEPSEETSASELFNQAMQGVEPLREGGRQIPAEVQEPAQANPNTREPPTKPLRDLVEGRIEFAMDQTDEFLQAHVLGMDSRIFSKLKAGAFSVEAHLDLHGLNTEQAFFSLLEFLRASYMAERRCLLVVTGRGLNSPEGFPVIKQEIQRWLTQDPLKRVVLAFCTALPRDGGAGAMYVLLRKFKKTKGKIVWDRLPLDTE